MTMGFVSAITIYQPYAYMVVDGHKKFETRGWKPNSLGAVVIHAGLKRIKPQEQTAIHAAIFRLGYTPDEVASFPCGAAIGIAYIRSIYHTEDIDYVDHFERMLGDWTDDRYAWQFHRVEKLARPIPYKGKQGIWKFPVELLSDDVRERFGLG